MTSHSSVIPSICRLSTYMPHSVLLFLRHVLSIYLLSLAQTPTCASTRICSRYFGWTLFFFGKKRFEMEPDGAAARLRIPKTPSFSDRFLPVSARSSPESALDGDLSEDEVFWIGDFAENNRSSNLNLPSVSPSGGRSHHGRGVARGENFGILAALPASESDESNLQARSVFNHKASVSSSASSSPASSSRMIPTVPKRPPLDRQHSSMKQPQSAPVNVPVMTEAMQRVRAMRQFDDIHYDDDTGEGEGEMLPPHEVVASRQSPMIACSVLEGAGRTLKGRDLRQVRNAVFRQTGFLD